MKKLLFALALAAFAVAGVSAGNIILTSTAYACPNSGC